MNFAFSVLCAYLPGIVCLVSDAVLIMYDKPGWGWFMLIGLLLAGGVSVKHSKGEGDDSPEV